MKRIMVNVMVPTILTDSADAFFAERPGIREKLAAGIPLRRFADPDRAIGPVTGQTIRIDGGQILRP